MANLILPSLEIQNFRAFEHLRIERLGRVNLITGKNNVGKTSLLEALYLYARDGSAVAISEMLETRDELVRRSTQAPNYLTTETENAFQNVRFLFQGRQELKRIHKPFIVGSIDGDKIVVAVVTSALPSADTGFGTPPPGALPTNNGDVFVPYLSIMSRAGNLRSVSAGFFLSPNLFVASENLSHINCRFVPANGWRGEELSRIWDSVALTPEEDEVLQILSVIAPVNRINFTSRPDGMGRIPRVRLANVINPVPLRSLGEGMNRLFGIALALTGARDGILLIDEVETGLHYSVMPEVWKLIFQVAERLNVQVFATTHSWDCIEAFQQAAAQDEHEEAVLIRLENRNGSIAATLFDERKLDIATRELIEVR